MVKKNNHQIVKTSRNLWSALPFCLLILTLSLATADAAMAETKARVFFSELNRINEHELSNDISNITGNSAHLYGEINPEGNVSEIKWEFKYQTTVQFLQEQICLREGGSGCETWIPVPGDAGIISGGGSSWNIVEGEITGLVPGTSYYVQLDATNAAGLEFSPGSPLTGSSEYGMFVTTSAPAVSTFATHGLQSDEARALGELNPGGGVTHFHFEYASQERFSQTGFSEATSAPMHELAAEPELGVFEKTGAQPRVIGENLPGLIPGEFYHYRLVASNEVGTTFSNEQVLRMPTSGPTSTPVCGNQAFRVGPSAALPDCRAYEQVTPIEKGGALDIYGYSPGSLVSSEVGESGNDVMIRNGAGVTWGSSPDSAVPSYVFSRSSAGWQMTSDSLPAEADEPTSFKPVVFSSDFGQLGIEAGWATVAHFLESPQVEFDVGPPGGPYVTAASVPRSQVQSGEGDGWVAASTNGEDFVLATHDRTLVGHSTGTNAGSDLYDYQRSSGELRQVNTLSNGTKISTCGALMAGAKGDDISQDGSRILFTDNCTHHLYMRLNGTETVDIGEYTLRAADLQESKLLLETVNGAKHELMLYETDAQTTTPLVVGGSIGEQFRVVATPDLSVFYIMSRELLTSEAPALHNFSEVAGSGNLFNLYRYVVASKSLSFVIQSGAEQGFYQPTTSPDGRYVYWGADGVPGIPGGGEYPAGVLPGSETFVEEHGETRQLFRYDSEEGAVECISCVSSFDPQPKRPAEFGGSEDYSSANGDYVIFHTAAALVPQDVDGEAPTALEAGGLGLENPEADFFYSASTDVYEWRAGGVDGCSNLEGCLALISTGTGGLRNTVLGISSSGRDLFFATHQSLAPTDKDKAGDVYDARIGGGFPPPPGPPQECENTCSTAIAAPIDATPGSLTFVGAGNPPSSGKPAIKPKKTKMSRCSRGKKRARGRCVKVKFRKVKRASKASRATVRKGGRR